MIKYLDNSILTTYIKSFLNTVNIPQCHIIDSMESIESKPDGVYIIKGNGVFRKDGSKIIKISNYSFNEELLNITKEFRNTSLYYDSYTHTFFGEYLRMLRDFKGIDLMSMYNCFSNEYLNNADIVEYEEEVDGVITTKHKFVINTHNGAYKIYKVPVKFDKKYTIAIDCASEIEMCAGVYSNNFIGLNSDYFNYYTNETYMSKSGCIFTKPFLYDKLDSSKLSEIYNQEKYLYLFIKVPFNCNSSITILEGDYTGYTQYVFDKSFYGRQISTKTYANDIVDFPHKLQLLAMNTEISYPFADRLIEYIVGNAIIPNDRIYQNIGRIQSSLEENSKLNSYKYRMKYYGDWDKDLSIALRWVLNDKDLVSTTYDAVGYVDKDLESLFEDDKER